MKVQEQATPVAVQHARDNEKVVDGGQTTDGGADNEYIDTTETMDSPKFMGLTGRPLSLMVSTIATTGFLLFGYDRMLWPCMTIRTSY